MPHLVKLFFLLFLLVDLVRQNGATTSGLVVLFLLIAVNLLKERYWDHLAWVLLSLVLVGIGAYLDPSFAVLLAAVAFDFAYAKHLWGVPLVVLLLVNTVASQAAFPYLVLLTALCSVIGYLMRRAREKEAAYQRSLDEERRLRYELEQTKHKLLHSSREVAAMAEVRERNRIAREIHDSVGHSIAGVLIQLQASNKLFSRDQDKALGILQKSIGRLADTVVLLRETVHNIKPRETLGIEYVKGIVANFQFCPVTFSYSGDFNQVPTHHLEVLATNLKEALTNAAKYSQATEIQVAIEANERYTRLQIRDNGVGTSAPIHEGLGLSGMRERVTNLGGNVSVSGKDGFLIVCFLPRDGEEGGRAR